MERRILTIGWVAVVAVAAFAIREWVHYRAEKRPSAAPPALRTTTPRTVASTTATTATTATTPAFRPPARVAALVLRATRGECWISVHRGSAQGPTLYEGVLATNGVVTVRATRLWVRFGAPQNVDATVDGRAVGLPATTADVVVTPAGVSAGTGA